MLCAGKAGIDTCQGDSGGKYSNNFLFFFLRYYTVNSCKYFKNAQCSTTNIQNQAENCLLILLEEGEGQLFYIDTIDNENVTNT